MHAILNHTLKGFIENYYSSDLYSKILNEAGLEQAQYEAENDHKDTEVDQVIAAVGKLLKQSRDEFLFNTGVCSSAGLLEAFKDFLEPEWDVLDMVEHVEARMHRHVREEMGAFPPALKTERINENELRVDVRSHRKMAGLAEGFIQGFAKHYGDTITIDVDATDTRYSFLIKKSA